MGYSRSELIFIIKELSKYAVWFLLFLVFIIYENDLSGYVKSIGFGGLQIFVLTIGIALLIVLLVIRKYKYIPHIIVFTPLMMFFIMRGSGVKPYQHAISFSVIIVVCMVGTYFKKKSRK